MIFKQASKMNFGELDRAGVDASLDQSSLRHNYLSKYEKHFAKFSNENFRVVVIGDSKIASREAEILCDFYPLSNVILLRLGGQAGEDGFKNDRLTTLHATSIHDAAVQLAGCGDINIIIEHGRNLKSEKLNLLLGLFLLLPENGEYFIEDIHSVYLQKFNDTPGLNVSEYLHTLVKYKTTSVSDGLSEYDLHMANALESLENWGKLIVAKRSAENFCMKIRESDAGKFFSQQWSNSFSSFEKFEDAAIHESAASYRSNVERYSERFPQNINIPEMKVRLYSDVVCVPGQVIIKERCVLPESFRMALQPVPKNRHLSDVNNFYTKISNGRVECLDGYYLHLDNEFSHHFGHITAEIISKLWAWNYMKLAYPSLKVLVGMSHGEISNVLLALLALYGLDQKDIVGYDTPTVVQNLICPTQQYHIGRYISPSIVDAWNQIYKKALISPSVISKKIFISRPQTEGRGCRNQVQVEDIFRQCGFEILYPERFELREQISIIANADVLAGFAGSGNLTAIYSPKAQTKIVICSDTYNADNEFLISSVRGGDIHYFWCDAEERHPKGGWSLKAFMSPYTFNIERDAKLLVSVCSGE